MPLSIGVNLRVTGHCNQGGRKYMEDMFCVAFQPTPDDKDLEYAFFGIFDGHGGGEAATFAKEHLMDIIVKQKNFWSDRDEDVLRAIRDGYMNTHYAMWRELDKWPRTASGLPSTAGTTASIAFIRKGKIYIGHVGDSAIILGYQVEGDPQWRAKALTKDHKPESGPEMTRIQESGGKVISKSGVPRVVWNRPRIGHKGPVRRSTHMDEIPFLAVARSLGDLWSYNSELDTFVVSPEPDVKVIPVDVKSHRCLIFGTDGLWNMLSPQSAVAIVQATDRHNEKHLIASQQTGSGTDLQMWINPSKSLVDRALERWSSTRLRADNTSVVTLMLDPSGPCRSEVLFNQKKDRVIHHGTHIPTTTTAPENVEKISPKVPTSHIPIPPPSSILNPDIDPKHPDSSDGSEELIDQTLQSETVSYLEKSILPDVGIASELESELDAAMDKSVETTNVGESIQVDEVSSSQMEETGELENKRADEVVCDKSESCEKESRKERATEPDETEKAESDNPQTPIESNPQSDEFVEPKEVADETGVSNVTRQNTFSGGMNEEVPPAPLVSRLRRSVVSVKSNSFDSGEMRNGVLNGLRHKHQQHPLFPAARTNVRTIKRRHSLTASQTANAYAAVAATPDAKTYVKSRYSKVAAKQSVAGNATKEETAKSVPSKRMSGCKRRHSTITQASIASGGAEGGCALQEPCAKRRTRSEDQRQSPTDENEPVNKATEDTSGRLSWLAPDVRPDSISLNGATTTTLSGQDKLSSSSGTFQRRSLGKKATPVKAIRRSSVNGPNRLQQLRGSFGLRDWDQGRSNRTNNCNDRRTLNRTVTITGPTDTTMPQRWLRSDTMAATPVKTLRSRNVDIAGHTISAQLVHQYGVVKQNRLPLSGKLKQSTNGGSLQSSRVRSSSLSSSKFKQANSNNGSVSSCSAINSASTSSTSGIAKRVKSPYNLSARSLSTRSRIKRLGK